MCLIIQRDPGKEIPFRNLDTAIANNPDGYGLTVVEGGGKLATFRTKDTPDTEELWTLLHNDLKDERLMLHLRYTTAGATNLRNAHPFPILNKREDGVDLRMAHNGTLSKYTNAKGTESDTRRFSRLYVRPLFKRLLKGATLEEVMKDDFTSYLLDDQLSSSSVLAFLDGYGNKLVVNAKGNGGFEEDGIYYSNKYSFDEDHRKPYSYSKGYSGYGEVYDYRAHQNNQQNYTPLKPHAKDTETTMFSSEWNLTDWRELLDMSDDIIEWVCQNDSDGAAELIKELIFRCAELEQKVRQ